MSHENKVLRSVEGDSRLSRQGRAHCAALGATARLADKTTEGESYRDCSSLDRRARPVAPNGVGTASNRNQRKVAAEHR
jgi:hypothetical protein